MSLTKKFLIFALFYIFVFIFPAVLQANEPPTRVRVGVYENRPQVYTDEHGRITGIYVDLINYIGRAENWDIEFVKGTWEECLERLDAGKIDILTSIAFTQERAKKYAFSQKAVFVNWGQVFVKSPLIEGFPDLEGKKIAVIKQDIYKDAVQDLLTKFEIQTAYIEVDEYEDAFISVKEGRADAAVVNRLFGALFKETYDLRETAMIFHPSMLHFAFPIRSPKTPVLKGRIDDQLTRLKEDKSSYYHQIIAHYMSLPERTAGITPRVKRVFFALAGFFLTLILMILYMRKEIQKQTRWIKENEQRLAMALQGTNAGLWDWDLHTNVLTINEIWAHLLGYEPEELTPVTIETWERLTHPEDLKRARKALMIHFKDETVPYDLEIRMQHKDGHWVWLMNRGKVVSRTKTGHPLRMIGTHVDITPWKEAENALLSSEKRYRSLFENNHAIMLLLDPTNGQIVEANPAACHFYGWPREQLVSMNIGEINTLSHDEIMQEMNMARFFKKNYFEFRHRLADGTIKDVEVYSGLIHFEERELLYSIIHDVSEKKEMEREKEKLETQLRRSQRLETIGTLTGGIAHDFNNILLPIIGYSEMILQKTEDKKIRDYLDSILSGAHRAKDLVRQLLTFSRQTEHVKTPTDICGIIHDSVHMLRSLSPSTISIELDLPSTCKSIMADRTQLHQVIVNLCTNATHAMEPDGGTLRLAVDYRLFKSKEDCPVKGLESGKEYLVLSASDTGQGMDEETMEHIFEPFFTTKSMDKGTGMGLSIVHGIVTSHNGFIQAQSTPGKGSVFILYFPVVDAIAPTPEEKIIAIQGGDEHILLVDDEETITLMLKEALTKLGYRVTSFIQSKEALVAIQNNPSRFNLLITDLTMPEMSGVELAQEARKINRNIPVIIMTGYGNPPDEYLSRSLFKYMIKKPFELHELTDIIREMFPKN